MEWVGARAGTAGSCSSLPWPGRFRGYFLFLLPAAECSAEEAESERHLGVLCAGDGEAEGMSPGILSFGLGQGCGIQVSRRISQPSSSARSSAPPLSAGSQESGKGCLQQLPVFNVSDT